MKMVSEPFLAEFLCLYYTLPCLTNQVGYPYRTQQFQQLNHGSWGFISHTKMISKKGVVTMNLDDCCIGIIYHRYL